MLRAAAALHTLNAAPGVSRHGQQVPSGGFCCTSWGDGASPDRTGARCAVLQHVAESVHPRRQDLDSPPRPGCNKIYYFYTELTNTHSFRVLSLRPCVPEGCRLPESLAARVRWPDVLFRLFRHVPRSGGAEKTEAAGTGFAVQAGPSEF